VVVAWLNTNEDKAGGQFKRQSQELEASLFNINFPLSSFPPTSLMTMAIGKSRVEIASRTSIVLPYTYPLGSESPESSGSFEAVRTNNERIP
jgi:hypothetical protein